MRVREYKEGRALARPGRGRLKSAPPAVWVLAALFVLPLMARPPQRDAPAAAVVSGTGEISGVVVTDETTPHPIRRAVVTVSGDLPSARSAITDDEGRFTFGGLPAGRFTVTVKKAAYLAAAYGATRPGRPGTPIALARDQRTRVTIIMARGAVVTGTIRNQIGMPLAGVQVGALDLRSTGTIDRLFDSTEFVTTDDRGVYRVFGLMLGEYAITALPRTIGTGEIGTRSAAEMDAVLAQLAQRGSAMPTTLGAPAAPPVKPIPPAPAIGFAPSYLPGTAVFQEATHLKLAAGEERSGVDFQVGAVPVVSVSGTVSGDVRNLASVQLSVIIGGQSLPLRMASTPILGQKPDPEGRFKFVNMAPGQYRITARGRRGQNDATPAPAVVNGGGAGGGRMGGNSANAPVDPSDYLFAVADVEVRGQEINGVSLALQPGSRLAGRLVLDSPMPPSAVDFAKFRLNLSPPGGTSYSISGDTIIGNTFSATQPPQVRPDGSFEISNIGPGTYGLLCTPPADFPKGWWLRSAVLNGHDLLDQTIDVEPGINMSGVMVTMSDKHTELSGVLQTAGGQPAPEYSVIVFPADRTLWRAGSRRMRAARPGDDGTFIVRDLPGGDYVLAAVTDMDPRDWQDPSFLDQIGSAGVKITLVDGARKTQDLRIAR
jgi:hypothetical protein